MFAFIKGELYKKTLTGVIIEAGGIGYFVHVSQRTLRSMGEVGDAVFLHTHFKPSDDAFTLFGFLTETEQAMFNHLISVGGIGAKSGLAILSGLTPEEIVTAVLSDDTAALSKMPGIGKKTAGRVILELKDKFKADGALLSEMNPFAGVAGGGANPVLSQNTNVNDAIDALIALGYSYQDSAKAVLSIPETENAAKSDMDSGTLIKLALKQIASKR